jgi:hypothetical protein
MFCVVIVINMFVFTQKRKKKLRRPTFALKSLWDHTNLFRMFWVKRGCFHLFAVKKTASHFVPLGRWWWLGKEREVIIGDIWATKCVWLLLVGSNGEKGNDGLMFGIPRAGTLPGFGL